MKWGFNGLGKLLKKSVMIENYRKPQGRLLKKVSNIPLTAVTMTIANGMHLAFSGNQNAPKFLQEASNPYHFRSLPSYQGDCQRTVPTSNKVFGSLLESCYLSRAADKLHNFNNKIPILN